jgi:S-adenosylmethionine decarboxylase
MQTIENNAYGLQLTLDGYAAKQELCSDVAHLYNLLMELPGHIGMRRVGFPHIIQITEPGIKGLSGFVFIMESHISIHTYEERGFVTADVYSCKNFDETKTQNYLIEAFGIQAFESNTAIRGKRFQNLPVQFPPNLATSKLGRISQGEDFSSSKKQYSS